jgi:hypothetical protein
MLLMNFLVNEPMWTIYRQDSDSEWVVTMTMLMMLLLLSLYRSSSLTWDRLTKKMMMTLLVLHPVSRWLRHVASTVTSMPVSLRQFRHRHRRRYRHRTMTSSSVNVRSFVRS